MRCRRKRGRRSTDNCNPPTRWEPQRRRSPGGRRERRRRSAEHDDQTRNQRVVPRRAAPQRNPRHRWNSSGLLRTLIGGSSTPRSRKRRRGPLRSVQGGLVALALLTTTQHSPTETERTGAALSVAANASSLLPGNESWQRNLQSLLEAMQAAPPQAKRNELQLDEGQLEQLLHDVKRARRDDGNADLQELALRLLAPKESPKTGTAQTLVPPAGISLIVVVDKPPDSGDPPAAPAQGPPEAAKQATRN